MQLIKYLFVFSLLLLLLATGCRDNNIERFSRTRMMMDTLITITVYGTPEDSNKALDEAFAVFENVEQMASFYLESSELSELNQTQELEASDSFATLLRECLRIYNDTEGYFDVSFAVIHQAYGFYGDQKSLPDDKQLNKLLALCGLTDVLSYTNNYFTLKEGSLLDLGGIAGGYAVDLAAEILRQKDIKGFLIDDAGDIWFEGAKPDNSPWRIAVRDPRDEGQLAIIESLTPIAIATSGDYERFIEIDGKTYGHIMNPIKGRPVDYYSSVTIIASNTLDADAYSTAAFAMPPEKAYEWVETMKLPALFLTSCGQIHKSSHASNWFKQVKASEKE